VVSIKPNTPVFGPGYRSNVVVWRPNGSVTMANIDAANLISRHTCGPRTTTPAISF
jgi:hypothetical protein